MFESPHPRLLPASLLALGIAVALQLLMTRLLSDSPKPPSVARSPAKVQLRLPEEPEPPPPTETPAPAAPASLKPPPLPGFGPPPPTTMPLPPSPPGTDIALPKTLADFGAPGLLPGEVLPNQPARARAPLRPAFPLKARQANVSGVVVARFTVDRFGVVDGIRIESVDPRGYGFEQAVRRTLRAARFAPAMAGREAVSTEVRQRFVFEMEAASGP
ncbi:MAG: energy transducer TonB [Pseudomonadota bacterium]